MTDPQPEGQAPSGTVQAPVDYEGNPGGSYASNVSAGAINGQLPQLQAPNFSDEYNNIISMLRTLSPRTNVNQATPEELAAAQPKTGADNTKPQLPETGLIQNILQQLVGNSSSTSTNSAATAANSAGNNATSAMNAATQAANQTQQNQTTANAAKSSGGGGGGILGAIGSVIGAVAGWLICTELARQGRMPKKYWVIGAKKFVGYSEIAKQGYYVWAIPSVYHLRKYPYSHYSRFLCMIFNWRAENLAYYAGVPGARKLRRGTAVTVVLWPICYSLGLLVKVGQIKQDWKEVYYDTSTSR